MVVSVLFKVGYDSVTPIDDMFVKVIGILTKKKERDHYPLPFKVVGFMTF